MKPFSKLFAILATASLTVGSSSAMAVLGDCNLGSVTVNSVSIAATGTVISTTPIDAASCYGAFAGNDKPEPTVNLGYKDDGLLNGETQSVKPYADVFGNGAFLTSTYQPYDLNNDGIADPGWIYLGKTEFGAGGFDAVNTVGNVTGIVWDSFFTASFDSTTGVWQWAFAPDADVASRASAVLGQNYFDQFALVFKQSKEFAAYNFTGEQFGIDHPSASDPILNFSGTADLSKVFGSSGLSHISLWARDPGANSAVPEPGILGLVGVAMLGIAVLRRRKVR